MTVDTPLASTIPTKHVELFGGAITTQVPNSFEDARSVARLLTLEGFANSDV